MDAQQPKTGVRRPVSREKMLEYLYRYKLKKKYRPVRPHTFANSQGLRTRQLENEPTHDAKKPLININVKARLEGNLQFLLENQNLNMARVKNPESFISLNVKKLKAVGNKSTSTNVGSAFGSIQTSSSRGKQRNPSKVMSAVVSMPKSPSSASTFSRLSLKSVALHAAGQNQSDHRLMPPPPLPTISELKQNRQQDDLTFSRIRTPSFTFKPSNVIPDADSFDFHSAVNQNRASQQFASTTSSKSKQSDERGSKKHSHKVPQSHHSSASNRSARLNSFGFDNDGSLAFDPMQTQNRTAVRTPSMFSDAPDPFFENQAQEVVVPAQVKRSSNTSIFNYNADSFDDGFHLYIHSGSCGRVSADNLIANSSEATMTFADRSGQGTMQRTRIIRKSVSRAGKSPHMEQIVIQKIKRKL